MNLTTHAVQMRAKVDGTTLYGRAAVFDVPTLIKGSYEVVRRGAFDKVLSDPVTDVVAVVEHDMARPLGRQSSGTLRLSANDEGLDFEVDLPDTSYARDVAHLISRGDLGGASIGFIPGETVLSRNGDGELLTEIVTVRYLRDVSPVTIPAYAATSVAVRAVDPITDGRSQLIRARALAQIALWRN